MTYINARTALLSFVLVAIPAVALKPAVGAEESPDSPATVLWDTGTSTADAWSPAALGTKSGWMAASEDDPSYRAKGDLVAMNDRLLLVLRAKGTGAEVYSRTAAGPRLRVVLSPIGMSDARPARFASVRVLENNPGAVVLAATFTAAKGGACSLAFRLTAGQMIVELRPGEGTGRVLVEDEARYVVVPDFFGDDMLFPAESLSRPRLRLPAENFFLNLCGQGNAVVMCVWQSREQEAVVIRSANETRPAIAGCEIDMVKDKNVWIAVLEGENLWHARAISADEATAETILPWKPPFAAKWRADLLDSPGPARSWYFHGDESDEVAPRTANRQSPCCLESGRAVLRLSRDEAASSPGWRYPASMVVYAMDRSRATPLTTFCAIDVLRNTLGVGPCQYILQTEGLASEANPTPDNVMTWIEKQFRRKKQNSAAQEIRQRLDQMVEHVGHAQARIAQYGRLGGAIRGLCDAAKQDKTPPAGMEAIQRVARKLEQTAAAAAVSPALPDRAARLAVDVKGLIGKPGASAECERLGAEVRGVGSTQDRALSNCRMMVRWLRASARMAAEDDPRQASWAKDILARTEQVLIAP
jgi:hypothetical protein